MSDASTATRNQDGRDVPAPGKYVIDPSHSSIEAVARHLVVSRVRGHFREFSGEIVVADDVAESSVSVEIDAASIDTREAQRDEHLRSGDFLDAENFPSLQFTSTSVEPSGDGWTVRGDLEIRDQSRPVELAMEFLGATTDPFGNSKALFEATTRLDREDYGITWNQALETGGVLVSKHLDIELGIQAVRQ